MVRLRKQYHSRKVGADLHTWDVHKLIRHSRSLAVKDLPLTAIAEIDELWWFQDADDFPTPRSIAHHMALVQKADLSYPIILCAEGRVMDGMHRVVKALLSECEFVQAVQFDQTPEPDFTNVDVATLQYPEEDV